MNRFFGFLKNTVHFCKILVVLAIILHLFYWVERLINADWFLINIVSPYLDIVRNFAGIFNQQQISIFGSIIDIKDIIAVVVYVIIYIICSFLLKIVIKVEDLTDDGYRYFKKVRQEQFNNELQKQQFDEQKQVNKLEVYIETRLKKKYLYDEADIDKKAEDNEMIKFIAKKMNIMPELSGNGYLYKECSFNSIDIFLDVLFELIDGASKYDYLICVHTYKDNRDIGNISKLINIRYINKITCLSDTVWKYNYKINKHYKTSHIGVYKSDLGSYEVFQFTKKGFV